MGRNKLLLPWGETTVIAAVVEALAACDLNEIVVVTGHQSEGVREVVANLPCRTIEFPGHAQGMGATIAWGVRACQTNASGFLIVPGDMPLIRSELIEMILAAAQEHNIVVPRHGDRHGNPVWFGQAFRAELERLSGTCGAREIVNRNANSAVFVDFSRSEPLEDIDSPEDYLRLRPDAKGGGS